MMCYNPQLEKTNTNNIQKEMIENCNFMNKINRNEDIWRGWDYNIEKTKRKCASVESLNYQINELTVPNNSPVNNSKKNNTCNCNCNNKKKLSDIISYITQQYRKCWKK
jgi:hypothetical protein